MVSMAPDLRHVGASSPCGGFERPGPGSRSRLCRPAQGLVKRPRVRVRGTINSSGVVISYRLVLIAPAGSPIRQPFAGGTQAHVWAITLALRERGHDVTLFAPPGSDPQLSSLEFRARPLGLSAQARADVSMPSEEFIQEHHAYLSLMQELSGRSRSFDLIHDHSFHYMPLTLAATVGIPMVSTLHTPPTPWLESAVQAGSAPPVQFVAVSQHTAQSWRHLLGPVPVVHNGVDLTRWPSGPGGDRAIWSGRITPEKAPHLALAACHQAQIGLDIAGPIVDRSYFDTQIVPLLTAEDRYLGHLEHDQLAAAVGHAAVAVVSPEWDEPYGLVVAEALACGTPVAAFARGGIPEIVDETCGVLAQPGDIAELAASIRAAMGLDRRAARLRAQTQCSVQAMVDGYEQVFAQVCGA
jgi:glycosyltransferase involved in cell wall biosynthesis